MMQDKKDLYGKTKKKRQEKKVIRYSTIQRVESVQEKECAATFKGLVNAKILQGVKHYENMKDMA